MFTQVIPPDSPCGCESGRSYGECHLQNGQIRLTSANIAPPGSVTGNTIRKCLFAKTQNCQGGISGDHIISAAILRQISVSKLDIIGATFRRTVGINSDAIKVKRLCRRHNAALSPLDSAAGRLFRAVKRADAALAGRATCDLRVFLFDGFDIERWLLKTLLSAYYAKMCNIVPSDCLLPTHTLAAFGSMLPRPYGLYVPTLGLFPDKRIMRLSASTSLSLITEGKLVAGIWVSLGGLELRLIIAGSSSAVAEEEKRSTYRPQFINFFENREVYTLGFAWSEGTKNVIWLSRNGDAPPPEDSL